MAAGWPRRATSTVVSLCSWRSTVDLCRRGWPGCLQQRRWWTKLGALSTVGLVDRTVQSVAACPSGALFAGTWGGGVFRYAGTSWVQVNQGLTERYISALLCSPQGILFAGTNSKGVFRSANAGSNWTPANAGLTDLRILTLQSHGDTSFVGTRTGAFKSNDGGVTWNATGLSGVSVYDFDFDPTSASRFWAATIPQGIQVTSDGGATWAGMGSALPGLRRGARCQQHHPCRDKRLGRVPL